MQDRLPVCCCFKLFYQIKMIDQTNKKPAKSKNQPSFTRSVFSVGGANSITIVFLFLETMIAVRVLDTASYGIFVLLLAITNFFVMFIDFGCKTAMPQLLASSESERQTTLVNSIILFRSIIIAAAFVIVLSGRALIGMFISSPEIFRYTVFILMMIMSTSFDELFNGILQGFHAYNHIAISTCIRSALRLILTIIFLSIMKLGMLGLVYSWFISAGASTIYQLIFTPIPKRLEIRRDILKEVLKFGLPLQVSRFIWFVSGKVNVFLLGILALPASVAFYDVGEKIPRAFQNLSASFITVFYPSITSLMAEGNNKKAAWMLEQSLRLISVTMAFFALVAVLFSNEIVTLLFSAKYSSASSVFAILMIAFQMSFLVQLMGYTLTSAGFPGRSLIENIVSAILIIVGNIVLIPIVGIVGAALATLIAGYIANPLSIWLLHRSKIRITVLPYLKSTIILLFCAGLFWWLKPMTIIFRFAILSLFIVMNLSVSTITREDLAMLLPKAVARKIRVLQKV